MVWTITIATFLGTVVAALLIFWIFSHKEQIREALKERRVERRIPMEVKLELSSPHEPLIYEKSATENVSRHGARIVSRKHWQPHDHVLVRFPFGNEPSRARITYCDALSRDAFAVGLHLSSVVNDWLMSKSDISIDDGSTHL